MYNFIPFVHRFAMHPCLSLIWLAQHATHQIGTVFLRGIQKYWKAIVLTSYTLSASICEMSEEFIFHSVINCTTISLIELFSIFILLTKRLKKASKKTCSLQQKQIEIIFGWNFSKQTNNNNLHAGEKCTNSRPDHFTDLTLTFNIL